MRNNGLFFLLAGLALAVVLAVSYGVTITKERDALTRELLSVQNVLAATQADLSSTKQILISTQSELDTAKQTLASTQVKLDAAEQRLTSMQAELSLMNQKLSAVQSDLLANKTKMDTMSDRLRLYEDTMGIKIYSGMQPLARGAGPIELVNNPAATDPSWQQLMSFLRADPTDDRTWTEGIFVSGDFAEMLHNNAEAAGIRAALVGVFFEGKTIGHGLNAFKTTDRGLVYVDSTGATFEQKVWESQYRVSGGTPIEWDKIAYMIKGREFGAVSIDRNGISPEYAYYERSGRSRGSGWQTMGIVRRIDIYW